jgi:lysophospholipase L1-like esterase/pimeloyl-ACP methyl ester carboxylesterase
MDSSIMRKRIFAILFLLMICLTVASNAKSRIRVACVGNSITYGAAMTNREMNNYPAQLQALLGETYVVRNFGRNGATLSSRGDLPYIKQPEYSKALSFKADVVLIELGTNDSKPQNRGNWTAFAADYLDLIAVFRNKSPKARIILLLPPPSFVPDSSGIADVVIKRDLIPAIQNVAAKANCEIISLYTLFNESPFYFPDLIHPSSIGAGLLAARLYEAIVAESEEFDLFKTANITGEKSHYYGFRCTDFTLDGRACKIVQPWRSAPGHPWIWRARFWGHEPQTEVSLLERGFHLVYCDVAELFGNDENLTIWDHFYSMLVGSGLSNKAVMEGFSRGGIYIYRWAAKYPDRVACIYADAPVLDIKSWPGNKGKGGGSPDPWRSFKEDFNFASDSSALAFTGSPLDLVETFVRNDIPMIHVCGEADVVVPIDENTDLFEKKVHQLNGRITVIRKPGIGHHPHSLANPQPIVDFILRATGYKTNFAVIPTPGNEYRSGAGWKTGMDWHAVFAEMNQDGKTMKPIDILFFGDSITQGMGGAGRSLGHSPGDSSFKETFKNYRWLNFGISGDRTQHLLWRIKTGNWQKLHPKVVVVTIGVNNFPSDTAAEVSEGMRAILHAILEKDHHCKILLVGPLPAKGPKHEFREKFNKVHQIIRGFQDGQRIYYSDMALRLLAADGQLDPKLFSSDGIHLQKAGYGRWAELLNKEIETISHF